MAFKRIRVPGEEAIDVAELLRSSGADWRSVCEGLAEFERGPAAQFQCNRVIPAPPDLGGRLIFRAFFQFGATLAPQ
jgi:hypothetical protein